MTLEALQEGSELDKGGIVLRPAEPDGEVLAPDFHSDLGLILSPGEKDARIVDPPGQVLAYHFLRGLHGSDEESDTIYPVYARLHLMGPAQRQPDDILEECAWARLFYDFMNDELVIGGVGDLQLSMALLAVPSWAV